MFEKEESKKFYQDLHNHKKRWKVITDDVNSTPAQKMEANKWLMFLSAETPLARNVALMALLVQYGSRVGYKLSENTLDTQLGQDPIDQMVQGMMTHIYGTKEG